MGVADYEAVRGDGAGIIDLSSRGRITVGGSEAVTFLNGLITNDMKTLEPLRWMPAVFPNVQGRMIAPVRVVRLLDEGNTPRFLLDTEPATHAAVLKTIERFTMAGDFKVVDLTSDTSCLSIQGKRALSQIRSLGNVLNTERARDGVAQISWNETSLTIIRASHTAEDGVDVIVDRSHNSELAERFGNAGAIPISSETFETLRIEAGVPRFGKDIDETNVVSETNLDDAVSFTKGCYIGQEIIARIKYRGHVAKKLTGLTFEGQTLIEPGTVIRSSDGKDVGRATSATLSPTLERAIALGYVRYEYLASGTDLIVGDDELRAKVTDLPFVRGSWYYD